MPVTLKSKVTLKRKRSRWQCLLLWWWPLIAAGLLAALALIFILIKCDGGSDGNGEPTTNNVVTPDTVIPPEGGDSQGKDCNEGKEMGAGTETVPDNHIAPFKGKMPYRRGVAYRVYRFPFDVSEYGKPDIALDKLASVLIAYPDLKIQIYAYTDSRGERQYNQKLSDLRAVSIYNYLVSQGIDGSRIAYKGRGISYRYRYHKNNRRADFILQ
jgi:hypothetical protein